MPLYGGIGLSVLAGIPFLAAWRADAVVAKVLTGRRLRRWRPYCFVAALRAWAIVVLVVGWLAVGLHFKWLTSNVAILLGVGLAVGIIGGAVFTPAMNLRDQYWAMIRNSLKDALGSASSAQSQSFNALHKRLVSGDSEDRRVVLGRILSGS
jgi:hypothetical protein